ncbi:hypothetical protein AB1E18_012256 [Capra hircus]
MVFLVVLRGHVEYGPVKGTFLWERRLQRLRGCCLFATAVSFPFNSGSHGLLLTRLGTRPRGCCFSPYIITDFKWC